MSGKTQIEWTDRTWNPVTGCDKVSAGCRNCYAETIARRFAGSKAFPNGFAVTLHPERMDDPLKWREPSRIFVNSMSDLFHEDVPEEFISRVWDTMGLTPRHTYQILTKRPERMAEIVPRMAARHTAKNGTGWPLANVHLGVSTEDQRTANERIAPLLRTPAAVRFISAEPLLGPISLRWAKWMQVPSRPDGSTSHLDGMRGIHWVIAGGESGISARVPNPEWFRQLRDQCQEAKVPFFFKQWGSWAPEFPGASISMAKVAVFHPDDTGDRPMYIRDLKPSFRGAWEKVADGDVHMYNVGKKDAGALLDGVEWKQYPR